MKKLILISIFTKIFNLTAQENNLHTGRQIYVIPVVFHIIHYGGDENISDAQVMDCVDLLTKDFRKQNSDTNYIDNVFKPIAADCEIEFRLASKDPQGNCTNGIEHIFSSKTFNADNSSKLNPWPDSSYLNIWVVHSLLNASAAVQMVPPNSPTGIVGFIILHNYVGSIGTAAIGGEREITHEMGHFFTLVHPWGTTGNTPGLACGDDGISDTPLTMGWDHCVSNPSICSPPIIENVNNFMEFSYCRYMFTPGQRDKMHLALNSTSYGLANLWSSANLIATGTDGSPISICSPVADFYSDVMNACTGTSITFSDHSWNAPITSRSWSFPGGNPSTSVDSSPVVTYSAAGLYNVQLTVTSASGIDSITKFAVVHISDTTMLTMPYAIDFEDTTAFPGIDGWVENNDSLPWSLTSNANATAGGSHSIMIDNFNSAAGEVDSWISPSIDFSNVSFPIILTFNVANAQRSAATDDELKIFYSINCGRSWVPTSYSKSGGALSTAGIISSNFIPSTQNQWRNETVALNQLQNKPNVRIKFQNTCDHGNNTYIDDINITGNMTSINYIADDLNEINLFPNPTNAGSSIRLNLNKQSDIKIDIKNSIGQLITNVFDGRAEKGVYERELPFLKKGIYLLEVLVNGTHYYQKMVVL